MTDHERKMIEAYIPHEPDPDLEDGEYYVMDTGGRVQKVRVTNILPGRLGEEETYGVVEVSSGRRIMQDTAISSRAFHCRICMTTSRTAKTTRMAAIVDGNI